MKKIILSSLLASTLLCAAEYNYEISPMIGYIDTQHGVTLENHNVYGVGAYKNLNDSMFDQLELALLHAKDVDYENSNLKSTVNLFSFNAIKEYKMTDSFKLYALAGLGYEHIRDSYFDNNSRAFGDYGFGLKTQLTDLLSLKLDVRHLIKFDGDQNILYTAGLVIPFGDKAQPAPQTKEKAPEPQKTMPITKVEKPEPAPVPSMEPKVEEKPKVLDSDHDGVVDFQDLCPNTPMGVKVNKSGCEVVIKPVDLEVLFDFDSDTIKSYSIAKFEKFVEYYKSIKNCKIVIDGHTDSIGSEKYNQALSLRRAKSAKKQLVSMGIPADKIITKGFGETKPKVPNDTPEHRQLNRRIEGSVMR